MPERMHVHGTFTFAHKGFVFVYRLSIEMSVSLMFQDHRPAMWVIFERPMLKGYLWILVGKE